MTLQLMKFPFNTKKYLQVKNTKKTNKNKTNKIMELPSLNR